MAGEENHLLALRKLCPDQFVLAIEIDGDDAARPRVRELHEGGLFHRSVARGEEDILAFFFQVASLHDGAEFFVFLETHQAGNGFAASGRRGFRNLVHLQPVHAALSREQKDVAVRRGDEEVLDEILFFGARADAALSAARLMSVDIHRRALHVARMAHGDQHFRVGDQVFELDFIHFVHDLCAPVVAVGLLHFLQLGDDHGLQFLLARQNFLKLDDPFADGLQFLENFVDGKLRQTMELQFEDGVNLHGC